MKIDTVGQLASHSEAELLRIRSFGKTSLREIKRKLADMGLPLGTSASLPEEQMVGAEENDDK